MKLWKEKKKKKQNKNKQTKQTKQTYKQANKQKNNRRMQTVAPLILSIIKNINLIIFFDDGYIRAV